MPSAFQPLEAGWVPHHGSIEPPPEVVGRTIRIRLRCYREGLYRVELYDAIRWTHEGNQGDIIAWRIIE